VGMVGLAFMHVYHGVIGVGKSETVHVMQAVFANYVKTSGSVIERFVQFERVLEGQLSRVG